MEEAAKKSRGRVVAALPFGFWKGLFGGRYEELWRQELRHAFPNAKERKSITTSIEPVGRFRNRLAHHDSILHQDIAMRHQEMLTIAEYIDEDARSWMETNSDVPRLLQQRP